MNFLLFIPIFLGFLLYSEMYASRSSQIHFVCEGFEAGKIDALQTLESLKLDIDDYSIGVNNTAKIFST